MRNFDISDRVICVVSGVSGIVEKFYVPTSCEEQTMVLTDNGRRYHAPTRCWRRCDEQCAKEAHYENGISAALPVVRETMQINIGGEIISVFKDEFEKELYKNLYAGLYAALDYGA